MPTQKLSDQVIQIFINEDEGVLEDDDLVQDDVISKSSNGSFKSIITIDSDILSE